MREILDLLNDWATLITRLIDLRDTIQNPETTPEEKVHAYKLRKEQRIRKRNLDELLDQKIHDYEVKVQKQTT